MEKNNEKAFIIGHVIPGTSGCSNEWSVRYRALMERYQHLIITHLFGHEHVEDYTVISDTTNSTSIGSIHIPGGLNTNGDKTQHLECTKSITRPDTPLKLISSI